MFPFPAEPSLNVKGVNLGSRMDRTHPYASPLCHGAPRASGLYGSHLKVHHPEGGRIWQATTRHSATRACLRGNQTRPFGFAGQEYEGGGC